MNAELLKNLSDELAEAQQSNRGREAELKKQSEYRERREHIPREMQRIDSELVELQKKRQALLDEQHKVGTYLKTAPPIPDEIDIQPIVDRIQEATKGL